jgi:hypothetical protein
MGPNQRASYFRIRFAKTMFCTTRARPKSRERLQNAIHRGLASNRVDLVHMHGLDFPEYEFPADLPIVITIHLPVSWYHSVAWKKLGPRARFCCVSQWQRRSVPPELHNCAVISRRMNGTCRKRCSTCAGPRLPGEECACRFGGRDRLLSSTKRCRPSKLRAMEASNRFNGADLP